MAITGVGNTDVLCAIAADTQCIRCSAKLSASGCGVVVDAPTLTASPFISLAGNTGGSCTLFARRADNTLTGWGNDFGQLFGIPSWMTDIKALGSGIRCTFYIRGGTMYGAGNSGGLPCKPPTGNFWKSVGAQGWRYPVNAACALRADGIVTCFGGSIAGVAPPQDPQAFLSAGNGYFCSLSPSGLVSCVGITGEPSVPLALVAVTMESIAACGITLSDRRIVCWGPERPAWPVQPPLPSQKFVVITAGRHVVCGVDWDQYLSCWGWVSADVQALTSRLGRVFLPETLVGRIPDLPTPTVGSGYGVDVCGAFAAQTPQNTASNTPTPSVTATQTRTSSPTNTATSTASLTASPSQTQTRTQTARRGLNWDALPVLADASRWAPIAITRGDRVMCAVTADTQCVLCSNKLSQQGCGASLRDSPELTQFPFVGLNAAKGEGCVFVARRLDNTLALAGEDLTGLLSPGALTAGVGGVTSMAMAAFCLQWTRNDGSVSTFGYCQAPPQTSLPWAAVGDVATRDGNCGLQINGDVTCWGTFPGWVTPQSPQAFLSAGVDSFCALRPNGTVSCYGALASVTAPAFPLALVAVSSVGGACLRLWNQAVGPEHRLLGPWYWRLVDSAAASQPKVRLRHRGPICVLRG